MSWVYGLLFISAYIAIGLKIAAIFFRNLLEGHRRVMKVGLGDEIFFAFMSLLLSLLAWPLIAASYCFAQVAKRGLNGHTHNHERIRRP